MNKKVQARLYSKTYWLGLIVLVLTYTQSNFALIKSYLGEYESAVNYAIGLSILVLREVTKKPLSDKVKDPNVL